MHNTKCAPAPTGRGFAFGGVVTDAQIAALKASLDRITPVIERWAAAANAMIDARIDKRIADALARRKQQR